MSAANEYIQRLVAMNPLREPLLRSAIEALQLAPGGHGLDAGCGVGLQMLLLAEAVGADGRVTGVDISPELLAYGESMVAKLDLSDRITFCQGDVSRLPFDDRAFDWVWSADCVGYPAGDLHPLLTELMRVLKPGGRIVILGWSSQQLLPGFPLLEARLNATSSAYIPFLEGKPPDQHFLRAGYWLRQAGLEAVNVGTLVGHVQAPLTQEERIALSSLFEMLWDQPQSAASPQDWEAYQRLCRPDGAASILDMPDYYGFFTYTMFQGMVPLR